MLLGLLPSLLQCCFPSFAFPPPVLSCLSFMFYHFLPLLVCLCASLCSLLPQTPFPSPALSRPPLQCFQTSSFILRIPPLPNAFCVLSFVLCRVFSCVSFPYINGGFRLPPLSFSVLRHQSVRNTRRCFVSFVRFRLFSLVSVSTSSHRLLSLCSVFCLFATSLTLLSSSLSLVVSFPRTWISPVRSRVRIS